MSNKPVIFFTGLMALALIIIVAYQLKNNPTPPLSSTQQKQAIAQSEGLALYGQYCARCHGAVGEGKGAYPALRGTAVPNNQIALLIRNGRGDMPAFPELTDEQVHQLVTFVKKL